MNIENSKLPHAEQVTILTRMAEIYAGPCMFYPGDLIQPRAHHGEAEPRDPWVVLEINPDAPLVDGSRQNMRIATVMDKGLFVTWTEHWSWERYVAPGTPGAGLQ